MATTTTSTTLLITGLIPTMAPTRPAAHIPTATTTRPITTTIPTRPTGHLLTATPTRPTGHLLSATPTRPPGHIVTHTPTRPKGHTATPTRLSGHMPNSTLTRPSTANIPTPASTPTRPTAAHVPTSITPTRPVASNIPTPTPIRPVTVNIPAPAPTRPVAATANIPTPTPIRPVAAAVNINIPTPTPIKLVAVPVTANIPTPIPIRPVAANIPAPTQIRPAVINTQTSIPIPTPTLTPPPLTVAVTPVVTVVSVASSLTPVPVQKITSCWLCGLIKPQDTLKDDKKFTPIWGTTEAILKKQRAANILLAEDGKSGKEIVEGDCVCQPCGNQIFRRMCIMEGKPIAVMKKPKATKKKGTNWIPDETTSEDDDDISILDSNSSSIGFTGTKPRRSNPAKKRKQDLTTPANKKTPAVKATKTGRTVKQPDRFTEKPEQKPKRSQNKATTPKTKPTGQGNISGVQQNSEYYNMSTSPPKNKTSSVSSLNLSSIFGEDNSICVEICIDNVASAVSAFKGGAKRIELCSSLSEGGLTPSCGFLREVKSLVKIPVFPMIRPRGGDFLYTDAEVDVMKYDIKNYKHNGADGFVFGVLDKNGYVDVAKCRALLQAADPLPCTFHRAFDYVSEPLNSLETVIKLGFTRLLTSGQKTTAAEGIPLIKKLVEIAEGRISIMAGAGINPACVGNIVARTGVREVHGSARVVIQSQMKLKDAKGGQVSMGQNPADDFSLLVTDANAVAQIVKAAEDALEAGKLITIL